MKAETHSSLSLPLPAKRLVHSTICRCYLNEWKSTWSRLSWLLTGHCIELLCLKSLSLSVRTPIWKMIIVSLSHSLRQKNLEWATTTLIKIKCCMFLVSLLMSLNSITIPRDYFSLCSYLGIGNIFPLLTSHLPRSPLSVVNVMPVMLSQQGDNLGHPSVGSLGSQKSKIWTSSLNKKLCHKQGIYLKRPNEIKP